LIKLRDHKTDVLSKFCHAPLRVAVEVKTTTRDAKKKKGARVDGQVPQSGEKRDRKSTQLFPETTASVEASASRPKRCAARLPGWLPGWLPGCPSASSRTAAILSQMLGLVFKWQKNRLGLNLAGDTADLAVEPQLAW